MKAVRMALVGAVVASSLGLVAPAAQADTVVNSTIVEYVYNAVRDRACTEEHGYGVVNCSETIDPIIADAVGQADPVVEIALWAVAVARQEAEELPGTVARQVNYVYCWMVDPTDPYCSGIIQP